MPGSAESKGMTVRNVAYSAARNMEDKSNNDPGNITTTVGVIKPRIFRNRLSGA
jgi:hypothetical protein